MFIPTLVFRPSIFCSTISRPALIAISDGFSIPFGAPKIHIIIPPLTCTIALDAIPPNFLVILITCANSLLSISKSGLSGSKPEKLKKREVTGLCSPLETFSNSGNSCGTSMDRSEFFKSTSKLNPSPLETLSTSISPLFALSSSSARIFTVSPDIKKSFSLLPRSISFHSPSIMAIFISILKFP